ncbi:MAG TPA: maltose alpha-D-glucosyltransferase [Gemmataceae bacterium]|nr:maltose alpha-D-glucosyltransferase [Gemmataceae bacterium]
MLENDPLWYKDAIIYELHVRSFYDSVDDGVGDFRGLTLKLDYLQDLGVTAIWLLPFYPSPLKDDGYDIADYTNVHPAYGTLRDFEEFLQEAHRRGLRVITELVLNHTSDQHPWFQRARRAPPGSPLRDFYVWSDTPEKYKEARIIFKDFESSNWAWDPVARAYYWHRFYSHQPDLNYDNPEVIKALLPVVDFWLSRGVDGMRLDAVPYLYEREGTNCENLPETHQFLKALRRHVDAHFPNRMLLAEANQWPEDAAAYFGNGDECHMAFHFPLMPRLFMAIHMEDRFPILDILAQTPAIPENCQWAMFLRNHDELTLEMVTDEERDYMYRAYALDPQARINLGIRRRLAPLLGNDRRRIELMNGLLFSLPGTPVIYYGDEIGMGDNIYLGDRNSVRTPMHWSADRNAGFSRANPQKLYLPVITDPEYHYEANNVEAQQNNPHSLLWWMKRLIALRKRYKAFGRGSLEFIQADNHKVLTFVRHYEEEHILVVANLSRFVQYAELHLAEYQGMIPVELFGRIEFPPIGSQPYVITLGPHSFYWFALEPRPTAVVLTGPSEESELPVISVPGSWEGVFHGRARAALEEVLPGFLQTRRWFGGRGRPIKSVEIWETVAVPHHAAVSVLALLRVEYAEGTPETYVLPVAFTEGRRADDLPARVPQAAIARLRGGAEGVIYDAVWEPGFGAALMETIAAGKTLSGGAGAVVGWAVSGQAPQPEDLRVISPISQAEEGHTSIAYKDQVILKLFRRVEEGINPDLEIRRFLTERKGFAHVPAVLGALEYRRPRAELMILAMQQVFVPNEGNAWNYTLDALGRYYEQALASALRPPRMALTTAALFDLAEGNLPSLAPETMGAYLEPARLLGQRTAELHAALASEPDDPAFAPEPFTMLYQRSVYQSMRSRAGRVFQLLAKRLRHLPEALQADAQAVLDRKGDVLDRFHRILRRKIGGVRIRGHGDYHLARVLYTGKDFVLIDFEGDPSRPLSERRLKRSALRDVANMLRSFHYAAYTALLGRAGEGGVPLPAVGRAEQLFAERSPEHSGGRLPQGRLRPEDLAVLEPWAGFWYLVTGAVFLRAYLAGAAQGALLPAGREDREVLLDAFLLERAFYELGHELRDRPTAAAIPLRAILQLLG